MSRLPRSTPEAQGIPTGALDAFLAGLDRCGQEVQTVQLVRHGHVVLAEAWAPYRLDDRHLLFSVSKSFTSIAVGLAVDAGLLAVEDKVISFFSGDDLPAEVSANLAALEVRHLLTMTTGHTVEPIEAINGERRIVRAFLATDIALEPGSRFLYNTPATYMLSAIVQKVTGEDILSYLRPRLFEPLGATEATWPKSGEGVVLGGWGLSLSTESLASFGQLLLQRGQWQGEQLVPAEWLAVATSRQVPTDREPNPDWQQGYGYQFWMSRHHAYRGDGAFGQYVVVFPEQDAVLAITSASPGMQEVLDVVWEHLLPALDGKEPASPVSRPVLRLDPPGASEGGFTGDGRTYRFESNEVGLVAVQLNPDGTGVFTFGPSPGRDKEDTQEFAVRPGGWEEQVDRLEDPAQRVVTSIHSTGDGAVATFRWPETPFMLTLTCRPDRSGLVIDAAYNVSFGPTELLLRSTP